MTRNVAAMQQSSQTVNVSLIVSKEIKIQEMVDSLKRQIEFIQRKYKEDFSKILLTEVNKYVGYKSNTLEVSMNKIEGTMKKLVSKVKLLQKSLFPPSHYVYHRDSGVLQIFSDDKKSLKHTFQPNEILSVRKGMTKYEKDHH